MLILGLSHSFVIQQSSHYDYATFAGRYIMLQENLNTIKSSFPDLYNQLKKNIPNLFDNNSIITASEINLYNTYISFYFGQKAGRDEGNFELYYQINQNLIVVND